MVTGLVTIATVKVTIATRAERVFSAKISTFITFNHKIRAFTSLIYKIVELDFPGTTILLQGRSRVHKFGIGM